MVSGELGAILSERDLEFLVRLRSLPGGSGTCGEAALALGVGRLADEGFCAIDGALATGPIGVQTAERVIRITPKGIEAIERLRGSTSKHSTLAE